MKQFVCEFCGIYRADNPRCTKCSEEKKERGPKRMTEEEAMTERIKHRDIISRIDL